MKIQQTISDKFYLGSLLAMFLLAWPAVCAAQGNNALTSDREVNPKIGVFPATGPGLDAPANNTGKNDQGLLRRGCSAAVIKGVYSYTAQGTILAGSPLPVPPGPFVSIGSVTLDGDGNITEHITNDNFNGLILPSTNYTGTYTVDENCSGTAVLVGRAPYKFTVVDKGNEIFFMLDAPGTVVTGVAKKR